MKIYLSYWTYGDKGQTNEGTDLLLKYTKTVSTLCKDVFGEYPSFITDTRGLNLFKGIKFSDVDTYLDIVPKEYATTWSLGKLYAINKIAKKGEPFYHLDNDFFITRQLPKNILDIDILTQSSENNLEARCYAVPYFLEKCKNLKELEGVKNVKTVYNCGILGGKDFKFFENYSQAAINTVLAEENKSFWLENHFKTNINFQPWTKATLAEQYFLTAYALKNNKKIKGLFDELTPDLLERNHGWYFPADQDFFNRTGVVHYYGLNKWSFKFKD